MADKDSKSLSAGAAVVGGMIAGVGGAYDGYGIARCGQIAYDTHHAYAQVDSSFQPDHGRHGNLLLVMAQLTKENNLDLTNPVNVANLEEKMAAEEARLKAVPKPFMPRWIQFTDAQAEARRNYETALTGLRALDSATVELIEYQKDLRTHQQTTLAAAVQQAGTLDLANLDTAAHSASNEAVNFTSKNSSRNAPGKG
ncbi:MAG: hypothetical protein M3O30_18310 [Planctomycetota bacterium]|nr:hypothetical protein [Planctomycetota bacterium]